MMLARALVIQFVAALREQLADRAEVFLGVPGEVGAAQRLAGEHERAQVAAGTVSLTQRRGAAVI